jgi:hypothetical protein
VRVSWLEKF